MLQFAGQGEAGCSTVLIAFVGPHCLPGDALGDICCGHSKSVPGLEFQPVQLTVCGVDTTTLDRMDKGLRRPEALSVFRGQLPQRLDQVLDSL